VFGAHDDSTRGTAGQTEKVGGQRHDCFFGEGDALVVAGFLAFLDGVVPAGGGVGGEFVAYLRVLHRRQGWGRCRRRRKDIKSALLLWDTAVHGGFGGERLRQRVPGHGNALAGRAASEPIDGLGRLLMGTGT